MTNSLMKHALPRDVDRALRRLLKTLKAAPAEIQALSHSNEFSQPNLVIVGAAPCGRPQGAAPTITDPELEISLGKNDDESARAAKLHQVANWLYTAWYTALNASEATPSLGPGRDNLVSALRASIAAATRWESGWVAMRTASNGMCLAGRGTVTRQLRPGEYINLARHGLPVAPGDHIAVTEMLEWVDEPTGFWCARSWFAEPQKPLVRLYFSTRADQVGFVLMAATETLDRLKLPYSLKCSAFAAAYARVDSLIIYLEAGAWSQTAVEIRELARRVKSHVRDATPPLTKKIARGVAFSEDPGTNESFGENRCRVLAPAVLFLLQNQPSSPNDGLATLTQALIAAGIDPVQPWISGVHHEQR